MKSTKICTVLIAVMYLILFNSCQKEEALIELEDKLTEFTIQTVKFENLRSVQQSFIVKLNEIQRELESPFNRNESTIIVDTTLAYHITSGNLNTYTFAIIDDTEIAAMRNLLISENDDGSSDYFLVEYTLDVPVSSANVANIEDHILNTETFLIDDSFNIEYVSNINSTQSRSGQCWTVHTHTVNYCDDINGNTQIDNGQIDTGCYQNYRTSTFTVINIDIECLEQNSGSANTGGGNGGNESGGSGGFGGPNSGGPNTGSNIPTSPKFPDGSSVPTQPLLNFLGEDNLNSVELGWINNPFNGFKIGKLSNFIIDYNIPNSGIDIIIEMINEMDSNTVSINEALLTIATEIFAVDWVPNTGIYNGISSLSYTHTRTISYYGYNHFQFRLTNGNILSATTYPMTNFGSESQNRLYYFSQVTKRWYLIPEASTYTPLSLDFLWDGFWNAIELGARYCTPLEDIVILIEGRDFEGVEQSRAVAAAFILVDFIPGSTYIKTIKMVKYGDEVVQLGEAIIKIADDIYKSQKGTIQNVLDGLINLDEFGNTIRKGNFGEMVTDADLYSKGYEPLHIRRTDIDQPLDTGIDGIFENPNTGEFIIVESKYHTSQLSDTLDGRQMSDSWIQGSDRLVNEVGQDLADDILDEGYTRVVAKISPDGTIVYKELNSAGYDIGNWIP